MKSRTHTDTVLTCNFLEDISLKIFYSFEKSVTVELTYTLSNFIYQLFWEVVGLERGPLSLVTTIEELLERKNSSFGLENRDYVRRDPPRWPYRKWYLQNVVVAARTSLLSFYVTAITTIHATNSYTVVTFTHFCGKVFAEL
jgi:hypothetical protein